MKKIAGWSIVAGIGTLLGAAALTVWWALPIESVFFSDGVSIREPIEQAQQREILWQPVARLADVLNTRGQDYEPRLSWDGLTLYFVRGRAGENADLWTSQRTPDGWTEPTPLVAINTEHDELGPAPSGDGQGLYFYSDRPDGLGGYDLWVAHRGADGWLPPANLGPAVNSAFNEYGPAPDPAGQRLYFASNRPQPQDARQPNPAAWPATLREDLFYRTYDLYVADRSGGSFLAAQSFDLVNSPFNEGSSCVSPAGDFLYFASDRPGGQGGYDLYRVRLNAPAGGRAETLGASLNTSANELDPGLTQLGYALYFSSDRLPPGQTSAALAAARGGDAPDYDLYYTSSRVVFRDSERRAIDWSAAFWAVLPNLLWALLGLLALLVLLAFLRDARRGKLSLLTRCLVASLMLHLVMMIGFNFWRVAASVGEAIQSSGRIHVTLASTGATDPLFAQVRAALTDSALPAVMQPADSPLAELAAQPSTPRTFEREILASEIRAALLSSATPESPPAPAPQPSPRAPRPMAGAPLLEISTPQAATPQAATEAAPEIAAVAPAAGIQLPTDPAAALISATPVLRESAVPPTASEAPREPITRLPDRNVRPPSRFEIPATQPSPTAAEIALRLPLAPLRGASEERRESPARAVPDLTFARTDSPHLPLPGDTQPKTPSVARVPIQPSAPDTQRLEPVSPSRHPSAPPASVTTPTSAVTPPSRPAVELAVGLPSSASEHVLPRSEARPPAWSSDRVSLAADVVPISEIPLAPLRPNQVEPARASLPATPAPSALVAPLALPMASPQADRAPAVAWEPPEPASDQTEFALPSAAEPPAPGVASPIGVITGMVTDRDTGDPIENALIRLDVSGSLPLMARTDFDGNYALPVPRMPDYFALAAVREGYAPSAANVPASELRDGRVTRDFELSPIRPDVIAVEDQPRVRHLGNDRFEGRVNSQFQRQAEGRYYRAVFAIPSGQKPAAGTTVRLSLLAKGVQCPHPVRLNREIIDARLPDSPPDGSFGGVVLEFDASYLIDGQNLLEIYSMNCTGDIDDFEFVNVQLHLAPTEDAQSGG